MLAAGPLLNPPLGPAIQPKISAILARSSCSPTCYYRPTPSSWKALDQIVLAAGPLVNPPLGPAIQPKVSAILAGILAAYPTCIDKPLVVGKL